MNSGKFTCAGLIIAALLTGPGSAGAANSGYVNNCPVDATAVEPLVDVNELVCVGGQFQTVLNLFDIFPCGDVYITVNQTWSGGEQLVDALGNSNRLCNGDGGLGSNFFYGTVALPPHPAGDYDIVLDDNANGVFDGIDQVLSAGSGFGLRIANLGRPVIDTSGIKSGAAHLSDFYNDTAKDVWYGIEKVDMIMTNGARLQNLISVPLDASGALASTVATEMENSYNTVVKDLGGRFFAGYDSNTGEATGYLGQMAKKYADIAADPPDPDYQTLVSLNIQAQNDLLAAQGITTQYPIPVRGTDPQEAALVAIANNEIIHGAIADAFLATFEKYQGAEQAGDDPWVWVQARRVKHYAELASDIMDRSITLYNDFKGILQTAGLADTVHDADGMLALIERVNTQGFEAAELAGFSAVGMSDIEVLQLALLFQSVSRRDQDWSWSGNIDALAAGINAMVSHFRDAAAQAQAVMDFLAPTLEIQHPEARAGAPYAGTEGIAISMDGSDSGDPQGPVAVFAWDTDLDGAFDDASGPQPLISYSAEQTGLVGLQIADADGNLDIAYGEITVASINNTPLLQGFLPATGIVTPGPGQTVRFSIAASDPDADPLTYHWKVDGVAMPDAAEAEFDFALEAFTEPFFVEAIVTDNNPFSEDVNQFWLVIPADDADGDGIFDNEDNCLLASNPLQRDTDNDGIGNSCDADLSQDCEINFIDLGVLKSVFFSSNDDADFDGDGSVNFLDLAIMKSAFFQAPGPSGQNHLCVR